MHIPSSLHSAAASDPRPTESATYTWRAATFPTEPLDEQRLVEVEDAWLTRFKRGNLRTFTVPSRWMTGAVHDARGRLVVESQKIGGYVGHNIVAADAPKAPRRGQADQLSGTWLYGGHFTEHFGHFISECVPTLWPEGLDVDGLVFHRYLTPDPVVEDWHREILGYVGYGDLPIHIVTTRPAKVDRLWVPTRPVTVNAWAHPTAVDVWQRIVAAAGGPAPDVGRVWFSRAEFNQRRREAGKRVRSTSANDTRLDDLFAGAGFRVVAPETLPVRDQIRTAAGATVLAGQAGTALHLAVFAERNSYCIEVGDARTPDISFAHQQVINAARGHRVAFIADDTPAQEIERALLELGVGRGR